MAREVFVVDAVLEEGGGNRHVDVVLWLAAPANRVRPNQNATPGILADTAVAWGYTTAELAAVRAGTIVVELTRINEGEITGPVTIANFQAAADALYTKRQIILTNSALGAKTIGMARSGGTWGSAP